MYTGDKCDLKQTMKTAICENKYWIVVQFLIISSKSSLSCVACCHVIHFTNVIVQQTSNLFLSNISLQINSTQRALFLNSLRPGDAIWRYRSWSILAQVMACCLTTPSNYLNQCWLMIIDGLWHSPDSNFTENTSDIYRWNEFKIG